MDERRNIFHGNQGQVRNTNLKTKRVFSHVITEINSFPEYIERCRFGVTQLANLL